MHTLKKLFLSSVPKLIIKIAAFALTSQIAELDNFNLDTSFEDFVRETQHNLLTMPVVQSEGEHCTEPNYDISSLMAINFGHPQKELVEVLEESVEKCLTEEVVSEVVKGVGYAIFGVEQLSPIKEKELLFDGVSEEDAVVAVVQKEEFTEDELICLEVLESGLVINQPPSFSFTQDGVSVVKSVVPSALSLKKAMGYKQAVRTAIDTRLRLELEDFNVPRKMCKKRYIYLLLCRGGDQQIVTTLLLKQEINLWMKSLMTLWILLLKLRMVNMVICRQ